MGCENLATKADVNALKQEISNLQSKINSIDGNISKVLSYCDRILNAINNLGDRLNSLPDIIANLINKSLDRVTDLINKQLDRIFNTLNNLINQIISLLKSIFGKPDVDINKILNAINDLKKSIDSLNSGINKILNAISVLQNTLIQKIEPISSQLINIYQAIKGLKTGDIDYGKIEAMHRTTRSQISGVIARYVNSLNDQLSSISAQCVNIYNAIKGLKIGDIDYGKIEAMHRTTRSQISGVIARYVNPLNDQLSSISAQCVNIYNAIKGLRFPEVDLRGIENGLKNANNSLSQMRQYNQQQFDTAREASNNIYRQSKDNYENLRKLINDQFNALRTALTGYVKQILDKLNEILAKLQEPLEESDLLEKIYKILGGDNWETDHGDDGIGYFMSPEGLMKLYIEQGYVFEDDLGKLSELDVQKAKAFSNFPSLIAYVMSTLYYRLGFYDYPIYVPKNLIADETLMDKADDTGEFGSPNPQGPTEKEIYGEYAGKYYQKVKHFTQYQSWQTQQLDSLFGQFPIKITIEDNDLIKTGDQPLEIKLPNLAETLAELMGLLLTTRSFLDANLNASMRTLAEVGSTKTQTVSAYYLLEAIQDYLGFKTKQKMIDVEFLFNPKVGSDEELPELISEALKNTTQKVKVEESDDKNSLEKHMAILTEAARIVKAVYWRKVNPNDISGLKDFLKSTVDFLGGDNEKEDDGFEKFLEKVERGFIDETGMTDTTNPYGRPYGQRPKIRRLGNRADGNTGGN